MDNSFKPQGEFKPNGEFIPQGEFNAPPKPREFVEVTQPVAIKLPYEKSSMIALICSLVGLVFLIAGIILLIPSISSQALLSNANIMAYVIFALFAFSALVLFIGILCSIKGTKVKYRKAVWAMIICFILLIPSLVILIYCGINGNIAQTLVAISNFLFK